MISDVTLRDGCHYFNHIIDKTFIEEYATFAESAGIKLLEVGHGYSLGCTNPKLNISDENFIKCVKARVKNTLLSTHINPDLCTVDHALDVTKDVDIVRLAVCPGNIYKLGKFLVLKNEIWVSLMYTSTKTKFELLEDCKLIESMNIKTVVIFDSAGNYTPDDVYERIAFIKNNTSLRLGFHGHNNLQLAVANSLAAQKAGASIIDASLNGIGAGAGNTPLEIIMHLIQDNDINKDIVHEKSATIKFRPEFKVSQVINAMKNFSPLHAEP